METKTYQEINTWQPIFLAALKNVEEFKHFAVAHGHALPSSIQELESYPLFLPRPLALEILNQGPTSLLWKQFVPDILETNFEQQQEGLLDPIGDLHNAKAPQIIHRYTNRVLFLPTAVCPVQCRYCFRKNELNSDELKNELFKNNFSQTLAYLNEHTEVEEIIFTGGDPLVLSNSKIRFYLEEFAKIKHIEFIRFHSRMPVIIPERIDQEFMDLLSEFHSRFTISLMIHTNQVGEWYGAKHAELLQKFKNFPAMLGSQTVLLKDHTLPDLVQLFKFLTKNFIRPYYLHHPDRVLGAMHFHHSLESGITLYKKLRQHLPGWAIPHYVTDSPISMQKTLVLDQTEHLSYNDRYGKTDSTH